MVAKKHELQPGRLLFKLKSAKVPDRLLGLGSELHRRGYALEESGGLRRSSARSRTVALSCTFVDEPATRLWRRDPKLREWYLTPLRPALRAQPAFESEWDLLVDYDRSRGFDTRKTCRHRRWDLLLLLPGLLEDPCRMLACGSCRLPIPLYRSPMASEVQSWGREWRLLNDLWLASGRCEALPVQALLDGRSDLNEEARRLCRELSREHGAVAWYGPWQCVDWACTGCPRCGRPGRPLTILGCTDDPDNAARQCGRCKLLFTLQDGDDEET